MMYDVIVIGAGPAGCTAAKALAENGYKVLLAEKCSIPRYKSCSGQIIEKTASLVKKYYGKDIPREALCFPEENRGMILTDGRGREYCFEQNGFNVWRSSFDAFLSGCASESGAEIKSNTSVLSCEAGDDCAEVTLRSKDLRKERAQYIINCEGAVGAVKKKLLGEKAEYIMTYQTYNKGSVSLDPHYFYAYLQGGLSEYDAWMNVKDNMIVLGVSVKDYSAVNVYYPRFIEYMKENHALRIDEEIRGDRWIMPRIRKGCRIDCGDGRILFAGEAAMFLNPMGEGISSAIESGHLAAEAVIRNFSDPEKALSEYKSSTEELRVYMQRQWDIVSRMSDSFAEMSLRAR